MNELESKFAQIIKQNKSTIYTVCYMFSKDADEVKTKTSPADIVCR